MTSPVLVLSREASRLHSDRLLRRKFASGEFTRIAAGVYMEKAEWITLSRDDRYRARVRAAALTSPSDTQFSHESAAAMWRLPSWGPWSDRIHELTPRRAGGNSRAGVLRHGLGLDPTSSVIDGVTVTSLARTLVDVACTTPFARAVTMVDDGLRPSRKGDARWGWGEAPTKNTLIEVMDDLAPYRGLASARRVVDFGTDLSGSPLETWSRTQFHALGLPAPELQREFFDERGFIGAVDFYWRELDLIVEVDGRSKYGGLRRYQSDLSPEQILWKEKQREDRLRRVVTSFARLDWSLVRDRRILADYLLPFGLVSRPRRLGSTTSLLSDDFSAQ
jgi:hypothetical protein